VLKEKKKRSYFDNEEGEFDIEDSDEMDSVVNEEEND
jgi:hypothetical protein